ncbi:hypothetical protein E1258_09545 [Micromonospora sp. KC207]|uniref:hypothetical protein n=1 Tax=Micromonospora sp. KC207 TaxID=2530377 RepID=UPI001043B478|nr:hypothetical protein [Micromonospora sp. KC207]TDC63879.1 hypothetical protein E1258_09545 [Micromonospora sp. KC207]
MALNTQPILDAVVSHALASGHFERVNAHEPTSAPGNGLSAAVWVDATEPARGASGLAATTARLTLNVRLYTSMLSEPADAIDPRLMAAHDALMTAYSADFTLGDLARCVDLLGQSGVPLSSRAGYLQQDSRLLRVITITLPVLVNDVWEQTP